MSVRPVAEVAPLMAVPPSWRSSDEFHAYRERIRAASSYRDAIEAMVDLVRTSAGRRGLAMDFAPSADWARRFVNSTKLGLAAPAGSMERRRAERAKRLLSELLTPSRVRRQPIVIAPEKVRGLRAQWHRAVSTMDRDVPSATATALLGIDAPLAYRQALTSMIRRHARPAAIADQLTAWQCGVPVRRVRESRTQPIDALHA